MGIKAAWKVAFAFIVAFDSAGDARSREALQLQVLAGMLADHASAARSVFHRKGERAFIARGRLSHGDHTHDHDVAFIEQDHNHDHMREELRGLDVAAGGYQRRT